ncbi:MAG: DNA-3-methyladenine glycosylase [Candidatus Falkowbacteria bacterium]|nr:DNA-3-methyladenine glycosylase [Candidatus Falkowbacteria bacterium]
MILRQDFFNRPTLIVAQELLGCFLVRKIGRKIIKAKIVETEAYKGPQDLASHASRGKTERNKIMFGQPGTIYVYFTYGMHYMFNIVTEPQDYPAAVLIRAVEPEDKKLKTNGPARLTLVLKIDKSFNSLPIYTKKYGLWIEGRKEIIATAQIIRAKRIGVAYAGKYKDKKWRYYLKDNDFVSIKN